MEQRFLWGVATSAYQAEGRYNGRGEPQTNWAAAEARGDVMPLGKSADFLAHYEADFGHCQAMGLNAFRMGIEWSRVQPNAPAASESENDFDGEAIARYAEILASARRHGLEPVVTLHHFTHPAWLGADPWLDANTIAPFERFVGEVVLRVNRLLVDLHKVAAIRYYITINEPNMLVMNTYLGHQFPSAARRGFHAMGKAYDQLLTAHVAAYNRIHDLHAAHGWMEPLVTLNNYCSDLYWSDKLLLDLLALRERGIHPGEIRQYVGAKAEEFDRAFASAHIPLHRDVPFLFGALTKRLANFIGRRRFDEKQFSHFLAALEKSPRARVFDYLGLDYYDPFLAHLFRLPVLWDHEFRNRSIRSWIMSTITSKWWDWRVLPRGLHFFCEYYSSDLGGRGVIIAENGMALRRKVDNTRSHRRDRIRRSDFLKLHVHECVRIAHEGVPLFGYLHWSLFDNYEWGSYTPRFGLFSLNYENGTERCEEDPDGDCPSEAYAALIAEARRK